MTRPKSAALDAVLSVSLTGTGLGVTCANAHGQQAYFHPSSRWSCVVPSLWCPLVMQPPQAPSSVTLIHPHRGSQKWLPSFRCDSIKISCHSVQLLALPHSPNDSPTLYFFLQQTARS
ncbi:hypothetical protein NUU61_001365 [Penicillium alfredii]|uniref:Secreted protein n=1 Tax=Penicillium alfredii TaxID=1506179 RepID=A0A9W9KMK2_9EURO|nr:uncharacterized protein NUU61_001365 [Penicillium alfredii]KAJ5111735.1 hypothetical protein NUU61_001365 [Penicillium alfredii]